MCARKPSCCTVLARAEVVETCLPHRAYPGIGGKRVDLGECCVELTGRREPRHLVGMQRDPGHHGLMPRGDLDRPPRTRAIAPDLDDPGYADGG